MTNKKLTLSESCSTPVVIDASEPITKEVVVNSPRFEESKERKRTTMKDFIDYQATNPDRK